jgi:hypothetical protein
MHNLSGAARLMATELDRGTGRGGHIIEHLLEAILAEAVRAHAETINRPQRNWFKVVRDTAVAKVLTAIHRQPKHGRCKNSPPTRQCSSPALPLVSTKRWVKAQ